MTWCLETCKDEVGKAQKLSSAQLSQVGCMMRSSRHRLGDVLEAWLDWQMRSIRNARNDVSGNEGGDLAVF